MDDEYAKAGSYEPKVIITTSRDPSTRLQQFAKVNSTRVSLLNYINIIIGNEINFPQCSKN
jgi:U3 small nucleolar ribonucleoprotein protein IMP4